MLLGLFFFGLVLVALIVVFIVKFSMDLRLSLEGFAVDYTFRLRLGPYFLAVSPKMTTRLERMIGNEPRHSLEEVLQDFREVWRSFDHFFQEIELFQLEVLIGFGDPFWTALGCGGLWVTVGSFLSSLNTTKRLKKPPEVLIKPDYGSLCLQVQLYCIFQFRLGQIIVKELKRLSYAWFA